MSRATEIPELVRRLGSRRDSVVVAAKARLCNKGARAVDALIDALEADNPRIRVNAMPLLALIQDPRSREPLVAMLLDRDARVRETAARSLARYPSASVVAALERSVKKERVLDVRLAAVQALLEQYAAGQERAIGQVLALLLDPGEEPRVRLAAFALLPTLRVSARRSLLKRLAQDSVPAVAQKAREIEAEGAPHVAREASAIRGLVASLRSDDYSVWNEAVHRLAACGSPAVSPLVTEMERRAHDPEFCTRVGMVLKALGPRRARALADAFDRVEEALPLQILVEVAGALGEKSLIYRLKDVIDRIAAGVRADPQTNGFDPMGRVRAKAHLELARVGSRVAVSDLRSILRDATRRLDPEVLTAAERIGTRSEIPDLLRAYAREDRFMRERVARTLRAIMKRERIRRHNAMFRSLTAEQRHAMEAIFPARPRLRAAARRTAPRR
ncbi:MAG: HEAT repeat domain-containing protein [Acidobacteriia bacterium]|nr:HEAT repeat domain-containing protein [Terriglobia bacterium]